MKKIILKIFLMTGIIELLSGCMPVVMYDTYAPEFSGTIRSSKTGKPIEGVSVNIVSYGVLTDNTVTDSEGKFTIGPLRHWFYLIYLGSPGTWPAPLWIEYYSESDILLSFHKGKDIDCSGEFWVSYKYYPYPIKRDPDGYLVSDFWNKIEGKHIFQECLINKEKSPGKILISAGSVEIIINEEFADFFHEGAMQN